MNTNLHQALIAKRALDFGNAQGSEPSHNQNANIDILAQNCESKKRSLAQRSKYSDANQDDFHPTDIKVDASTGRLRIPFKLEEAPRSQTSLAHLNENVLTATQCGAWGRLRENLTPVPKHEGVKLNASRNEKSIYHGKIAHQKQVARNQKIDYYLLKSSRQNITPSALTLNQPDPTPKQTHYYIKWTQKEIAEIPISKQMKQEE